MVAKWIEQECRGYAIAGIEVKKIDYMDDGVCIADTKEEICKMTTIQSEFAERMEMRFGINKCTYWGRKFVRGRGADMVLLDFNLCGGAILQLADYEPFKYMGKHKALALRRLIRNHPYRGVSTTRGKRPTKASSSSPHLRRGWLNWILRVSRNSIIRSSWIFLSQTVRPLIEILSLINPSPNYIMGDATRIQHGAARRILGWPSRKDNSR